MIHPADDLDDIIDHPEFAGVLCQHWHCTGDERQPWGSKFWCDRDVGLDLCLHNLAHAQRSPDTFSATPLYTRPSDADTAAQADAEAFDRSQET